jgi:hypothetical protein
MGYTHPRPTVNLSPAQEKDSPESKEIDETARDRILRAYRAIAHTDLSRWVLETHRPLGWGTLRLNAAGE